MVNKKSSRINDIKYKYMIHKKFSIIQEAFFDDKNNEFKETITFSINNINDSNYEVMINSYGDVKKIKAYYRVKNWLVKNYPELII